MLEGAVLCVLSVRRATCQRVHLCGLGLHCGTCSASSCGATTSTTAATPGTATTTL